MLTFIEERRQRIRKAWEEGYAEGLEEGRAAWRAENLKILRRDPRIDAELRDDPEFRKELQELGFDIRDEEKNDNG